MYHRLFWGLAIALVAQKLGAREMGGAKSVILVAASNISVTSMDETASGTTLKETKARAAFKRREYGQVIDLLTSDLNHISQSLKMMLVQSLEEEKNYQEEIRVIQLILKSNPQNHLLLTRLGNAYAELKNTDEASKFFRLAITNQPKYLPAHESLLYLFESTNNLYEARIVIKDMVKLFGRKVDFLHKLCRIDSVDGYLESSTKVCLEAIFKDPKYPDSYVYLANNYRDAGEKEKAQKSYADAAKRFPFSEFVQSAAGLYFIENHDFYSAYRYFGQAVKVDKSSVRALVGLAKSAIEIGEYREALESFMRACRSDKSVAGDFRRAAAQLRMKRVDQWIGEFESKSSLCRLRND